MKTIEVNPNKVHLPRSDDLPFEAVTVIVGDSHPVAPETAKPGRPGKRPTVAKRGRGGKMGKVWN